MNGQLFAGNENAQNSYVGGNSVPSIAVTEVDGSLIVEEIDSADDTVMHDAPVQQDDVPVNGDEPVDEDVTVEDLLADDATPMEINPPTDDESMNSGTPTPSDYDLSMHDDSGYYSGGDGLFEGGYFGYRY